MSSSSSGLVLSRVEGGVAWLTLNRPEKRNALNGALVAALKKSLEAAEGDPHVRVVALAGAGKDFCAGADLSELEGISRASVEENLADAGSLGELFVQLRRMSKPVVAIVHGRALAGGCGLATACDLVVAGESATFGYPEVRIGFVAAMVMAILRRNLGEKRAFELVALGETLPAERAHLMGLLNRVYPDSELEHRAAAFVRQLAANSGSAVHLSKRLLYRQDSMSFEAGIRSGAEVNVLARLTPDARDGIARFTGSGGGEG